MTVSPPPTGPDHAPLLTAHSALVLLMAMFFGTVISVLAYFSVGGIAGALLAGLPAFGISAAALHKLIGP
ncbi:hypothetical protein [Streptomyces sp. NBC_01205]|uniref:hypothetical protein n=1 Tax=Streptomyces sp. NBC_01205 TaxID=2903771 RepID=UPI002E15EE27|nr:hypothetical protein OG573_43285 [Streptomyces sp. NBC_01205]